jgi:hypothetical protein
MNFFRPLAALAIVAAAATGCAHPAQEACSAISPGRADSAIELLTPGQNPDLLTAVAQLAYGATPVFASKDLGLETKPGTVVLATYDLQGQVQVRGAFNLGGVATGDLQRQADANRQAQCLASAARSLPEPPLDRPGGDLLRALPNGAAQARSYSGTGRVLIAAFGFGKSGGDGFEVSKADLSTPAARSNVLTQLEQYRLVPDLGRQVGVVMVAPDAGISSGIGAAGVDAFAQDLCARLGTSLCRPSAVLS